MQSTLDSRFKGFKRMIARRTLLKSALGWAAGQAAYVDQAMAAQPSATVVPQGTAATGQPQPFDYAWLKGQAHHLASNAYQESKDTLPPSMAKLGYDQYQSIRFRTDRSVWG